MIEIDKDICMDNCVKQRKYIFIISDGYFHALSVDRVLLCLFYSHALIEYLVPGDWCFFFSCEYVFFLVWKSTMLTAIPSQPKPTPKTYFLHRVNLLKLADRTKCSAKTSHFWKHPINFRNNYLTVQGHFWVFIERKIWQIKWTESISMHSVHQGLSPHRKSPPIDCYPNLFKPQGFSSVPVFVDPTRKTKYVCSGTK